MTHCPHCNVSLQGEPIPQEHRDAGYYGDKTHFRREIGIEIRGAYDGVLFWQCPDCHGRWHRWPEGSTYWKRAERYVNDAES